ncbi:MAG: glycosyltransferase [Chthoniobacterales bacterium]|nr:glycosyltransferase [Chthoniobacterales bacterium]
MIKIDRYANKNVSVIVRDNCSTDHTDLVLRDYQKKTKRKVEIIRTNENEGIDLNIQNIALRVKTKWFLYFSDDDDFEDDFFEFVEKELPSWDKDFINLVYFNYSEWNLEKNQQFTERQIKFFKDQVFSPGFKIISLVAEMLPLISCLLIRTNPYQFFITKIPIKIKTTGVGFVWALLQSLKESNSLFISKPYIRWNNTDPERGFCWKNTAVTGLYDIIKEICPQELKFFLKNTLNNQIIPRSRNVGRKGNFSQKIDFFLFTISYYYSFLDYWYKVFPRLFCPKIFYQLYYQLRDKLKFR